MTNAKSRKVIIIGTGPAGLTAAIYAARANLSPLIFEGHEPGGQLTLTTMVENFPGFPEGILGPDLMNNMKAQASHFGAEFIGQNIQKVNFSGRPFKVYASGNEEYTADAIIISTGASAKFLGLANEKQLIGKGVSTCATCDGFFFRNQIIHVVGGGDTAMEESNFLTRFASKVTIIHRKDSFRASKAMQQKIFSNPKIEVLWNSAVTEILHDAKGVTGIKVEDLITGKISERPTQGLFYGIGHTPNTAFLDKQVALDSHGLIVTERDMATSVPGVFACGDVQDAHFRQAITAAGTGCQAAMMAEKFLEKEHKK